MKGRPYRAYDFRDALVPLGLLPEVAALGAYGMNHLWAATFKITECKKKMLSTPELTVKGRRCLVVDPCHQDFRVKLRWLLFNVADDDVGAALAPYGKVIKVAREMWRVDGCQTVGTMTRTAVLRPKAGVTLDDIPHLLLGGADIRKECHVPRCNVCRRFGHEGSQCVQTYAAAAAPEGGLEKSELLMDEAEVVETNAGSTAKESPVENEPIAPSSGAAPDTSGTTPHTIEAGQAGQRDVPAIETSAPLGEAVVASKVVKEGPAADVTMADQDASAGGAAAKRTWEYDATDPTAVKQEEPPPKAAAIWRRRAVKPNIPADDIRGAKPLTGVSASTIEDIESWTRETVSSTAAYTKVLTVDEETPCVDPHLLHLWDTGRSLTKRWKNQRFNRKLKIKIQEISHKAEEYATELTRENWYNLCDSI
ncbi:hypothetical protein HPB47_010836 [Ixodes persulcatus]|uniref:Uncharacterized protein n=1 Tax=Ixodes persulcatus TaxID=34615 RepID=A0AC60NY97_IXOPE|nr:hypothetical protein HPB47_010836 [Ixodes persulcatus]